MRGRSRTDLLLSSLFVVAMGCGGVGGGCGACGAVQPLPEGGLPTTQTIEGGAQIRVTQTGFQTLTSIIPGLLNDSIGGGFCVDHWSTGTPTGGDWWELPTGIEYCYQNDDICTGSDRGCKIDVSLNGAGTGVQVVNTNLLRVNVSASVETTLPVRGQLAGVDASCTLQLSSTNLGGSFDIALAIRQDNGELDVHLDGINQFGLNLDVDGCGLLGDILDFGADFVDAIVDTFGDFLVPVIDPLLAQIIPNPLGVAGLMDVGALLAGFSPGTDALMEARVVPGGYVAADTNGSRGLSLGVITGMNADQNIATRTGLRPDNIPNISEPHLCVPPMSPPAFAAPPHNLGGPPDNPARGTFFLAPGGELAGSPEPNADIAIGLSETFMDLAGHHLVSSGAMCMGIGGNQLDALSVGTISLLVPSLGDLTSGLGKDPMLLVTRPQRPVDVTIGDNTTASPGLTLGIRNLEVDFYAFIYERYVRAFTLDLTMNLGIILEFEPGMNGGPAQIRPMLTGISADTVGVRVLNAEFVRETPEHLEMVLPSVFDLVTPLLGNIGTIDAPDFAGLSLSDLGVKRIVTPQDDFLALTAKLGPSVMMRTLAEREPLAAAALEQMEARLAPSSGPRVNVRAHVRSVRVPDPAAVRHAMTRGGPGMPEVTFDAPVTDELGRPLEYTYNLNGGLFRPYRAPSADGTFVVRDPAFAWQSKYRIGIKSRVVGDYRTTSDEIAHDVIIDSVGPNIGDEELFWDGDALRVPLFDEVSKHVVRYAFGAPGADEHATEWTRGGTAEITRAQAEALAVNGEVVVFAEDEAGNRSIALIAPFHGTAGEGGCDCSATGGPSAGGIALFVIVGGVLMFRRRRVVVPRWAKKAATASAVVLASSVIPACDCNNDPAASCEVASDCDGECSEGQIPFCIDGTCQCSDDIIAGRVGAYSDVAVGTDGSTWVSGYAVSMGDLVVAKTTELGRIPMEAWEWVDGVPDGPVVIAESDIRGGISAPGPDVGMYTSIAVDGLGQPMVSYFDRDSGSLKFAHKVGDAWATHTIQQGSGRTLGEHAGEVVGMYTSLTLRSDDGRPGIAYLAHVRDDAGTRAEVRYARALTATPSGPGDWQLWIVEAAPLTAEEDAYPLPQGLGLFVDSALLPDQSPVVVYYDRANGDLKMAKFDAGAGQFGPATVLDGSTTDAGWTPSIAIDDAGMVHVAYVGATGDDLMYLVEGGTSEIIDNGYRIVGTTPEGLPKPEFHFVGDDVSLQIINGLPVVTYQDATTQELMYAQRLGDADGWLQESLAGHTDPWPGAYGFFAASTRVGPDVVISTWVINQPAGDPFNDNWVEIFRRQAIVQ